MNILRTYTKMDPIENARFRANLRIALPDEICKFVCQAGQVLVTYCHHAAVAGGWWTDLHTGESLIGKRNVPETLCLVHSEISEAMELHLD